MLEKEIESPTFKKEFWAWFDTLPVLEKQKFWYYGSDMAEIFYYNKIYSRLKINVDNRKNS